MSDRAIREGVTAALERMDLDWAVAAAVEGGVVSLFGRTPNGAQRFAAEVAACRAPGVRAVLNRIEVRPAPDPDARIACAVADALAAVEELAGHPICVSVAEGVVTLQGEVAEERLRILAEQEALRLSSVNDVRNLVHVALPSGDPASQLLTLMRRQGAETRGVQVKLHEGAVELSGQAAGWFDRDAAERLAWTLPGVHAVTNRIALPEGAVQPEAGEGAPA
jgi:osmotically-inducible protein OsmY